MAYQKNNFAGVPFKTLLDKGHKEYNLAGVETEILQFPCAENGNMAVFRAVVKNTDGATFSAHGDADPKNTTSPIAPHLLRMAETRAIARALRWLTNSGETAHVEISGDEDESDPSRTQQTPPGEPPAGNPDQTSAQFKTACEGVIANIADLAMTPSIKDIKEQAAFVLTGFGFTSLDDVPADYYRRVFDGLKAKLREIEERKAKHTEIEKQRKKKVVADALAARKAKHTEIEADIKLAAT